MGTLAIPPSPASPRRPLRGWGAHFSLLFKSLSSARLAFVQTWRGEQTPENPDPTQAPSQGSDLSYWDDEEAVKREREDDIRHQLGLGKQDSERLMEEWRRIYAQGQ